jgi:hypothetical protein
LNLAAQGSLQQPMDLHSQLFGLSSQTSKELLLQIEPLLTASAAFPSIAWVRPFSAGKCAAMEYSNECRCSKRTFFKRDY